MDNKTEFDVPDEDDLAFDRALQMGKQNFVPSRLVPFGQQLWNFYVHSYHAGNNTVN